MGVGPAAFTASNSVVNGIYSSSANVVDNASAARTRNARRADEVVCAADGGAAAFASDLVDARVT